MHFLRASATVIDFAAGDIEPRIVWSQVPLLSAS